MQDGNSTQAAVAAKSAPDAATGSAKTKPADNPAAVLQVERRDYQDLVPNDRPRVQSLKGFDDCYTDIVDYIVRCTHRIWDERDVGLIYSHYTHNCVIYGVLGTMYDRETIVRETIQRIVELPDRRGMATQVIWRGNDVDGFYTSHMTHGVGRAHRVRHVGQADGSDLRHEDGGRLHDLGKQDLPGMGGEGQSSPAGPARRRPARLRGDHRATEVRARRDGARGVGEPAAPRPEPARGGSRSVHRPQRHRGELLRWLHHIYNRRMFGKIQEIYASNCQWHGPLMRELYGVAAVLQQTMRLVALIPDGAFVPQHVCSTLSEEGGVKVAVRWILDGHHLGYGSLGAPTGHKLVVMGMTHFHIVEGKIIDEWVVYDDLSLMVQLKVSDLQAAA